jgi:hypothetical protein
MELIHLGACHSDGHDLINFDVGVVCKSFVLLVKVYVHSDLHLWGLRRLLKNLYWLVWLELVFQELLILIIFVPIASALTLVPFD